MNQSSGGPPQHWLDLVREKAPELLSMPRNEPSSQTAADVPRERIRRPDSPEAPKKQAAEVKESQSKPLLLKYAKLPRTLRDRTMAKARALMRSKFVTSAPSRKSTVSEEPPPEPQERRVTRAEDRSAVQDRASTKPGDANRKVDLHLPTISSRRSEPHGSTLVPTHSSSSKTIAFTEPGSVYVTRTKAGPGQDRPFAYPESQPSRMAQQDASEQNQGLERQSAVTPHEPTVRPRRAGNSAQTPATTDDSMEAGLFRGGPAEETSEYVFPKVQSHTFVPDVKEEAETDRRISVSVPSRINTATQEPASSPGTHRKRPVSDLTTFAPSSSRRPLFREDLFDKADVNLPALIDEETMDRAAAAQWDQTVTDENPWPDLPSRSPLEIEDDLSAYTREVDRYRRLELEQRGTLWNE